MASTNLKAATDHSNLRATIASSLALLSTFQASLASVTPSAQSDIANPPNPLRLLSDACSVLKAQTTKLSLLILNKPFTPTAITFILKNISSECLPTLMTALQLCSSTNYTVFMEDHIRAYLARIMRELTSLLGTIPTDEKASLGSATATKDGVGRDTLPSTGVIWQVCDEMINLASVGLADHAAMKADAYHALIKDAIAELEGWNPDDEEEDILGSGSPTHSEGDQDTENDSASDSPPSIAMNVMALTPPATPSPIQQIHKQTLANLRLIRLLYPPLRKRRIMTFPPINSSTSPDQIPTSWQIYAFDSLMKHLRIFSETTDDLAGALYSRDEDQASDGLEAIRMQALECVQRFDRNWDRKEDEFTAWSQKWTERMQELRSSSGSQIS